MAITRLSGGLSPADGSDPRTFPLIFDEVVDAVEAVEGDVADNATAVGAVDARVDALDTDDVDEAGNLYFTDARADGRISAASVGDLSDVDVTGASLGEALTFNGSIFVPEPAGGAGGLVAVKSALIDSPRTFTNITTRNSVLVTGLSITHAMENASNRLIISAFFGGSGVNDFNRSRIGLALHNGLGFINIGVAAGNRSRVTAGGQVAEHDTNSPIVSMPSVTTMHSPGTTASRTYSVRAVNMNTDTRTLFVNRTNLDTDNGRVGRHVSSLIIQEVSV